VSAIELQEHSPTQWFWEADSDNCPHGPEPEDDTAEAWDIWQERHTGSPQDVFICLDAPAGEACEECSGDANEFVSWSACAARPRVRKTSESLSQHRAVTVPVGRLECLGRECDDFFTDDGDEIPGKTECSHLHEMEICEACSEPPPGDADEFPPVVAWTDCKHKITVSPSP
jgi:hypothetical protein